MGLHLSMARSVAPWLLAVALAMLAIVCVLVGAPAADDIGSWRWTAVRPA
jgi:hypothetical protein